VVLLKEEGAIQDAQLKDKSKWEKEIYQKLAVINCPSLLSYFHYSFSFNFFSCSIYSIGKYMSHHVTEGVILSHQKMSCHMSCHTSFGWERGILGA